MPEQDIETSQDHLYSSSYIGFSYMIQYKLFV